jgi:hypothetical protein
MTFQISAHEAEARALLTQYEAQMYAQHDREVAGSWAAFHSAAVLCRVFSAMPAASLPVERIVQVGAALVGAKAAALDVELPPALTAAVRAKVLRSRMIKGVRHYEVALAA